jgi:hypothetical protein
MTTEANDKTTKPPLDGPPRLSLQEAEQRLHDPYMGYQCELRQAFAHPSQIAAEDIFVDGGLALERGKGNPNRGKLATKVLDAATTQLSSHFSCASKEDAKLLLKLHVVDVSEGDKESRIVASESGVGLVRLCLVWILCLQDGKVVLDGGRIGEVDGHMCGIWDMLHIKSGEGTLVHGMTPRMCDKIQRRIDIRKRSPWYKFW